MSRLGLKTISALACLAGMMLGSTATKAQSQQDGPVFSAEQMRQGISMSHADCTSYRSTVWVVASGMGLCFRYYLSMAGGQSNDVVYFLPGDHPYDKMAYDPADLDRNAHRMSMGYRRPAIYLARMGTDGSSGWERYRRTWFEVEATHRAIDAINARHGFRMVHVMGQSGGGHLTGALVGTRQDIGCAIPGSGRLAFDRDYAARQARRPAHARHYSPDSALSDVVRNSASTRILVVTDPNDRRVPAHMQSGFVQAVQQAGGRISQFFISATDELNHGATPYIRKAMSGCLQGQSDEAIGASLDQLSRERWAAKNAQQVAQQAPIASATPYQATARSLPVSTPPAPPPMIGSAGTYPALPATGPANYAAMRR